MCKRTMASPLLALVTIAAALAASGAQAAGSHGGAVVFSRVVTKTTTETVRDAEGNPLKDKDGNPETRTPRRPKAASTPCAKAASTS